MAHDYRTFPTTAEVWRVILRDHPDLTVFSSYTAPDGDLGLSGWRLPHHGSRDDMGY